MAAARHAGRSLTPLQGWLLAGVVAGLCVAAGLWQWGRMHEKQAVLDAVAQVLERRVPGPLAVAADVRRAHDYDWAAGRGRFADLPVVLLDNQQREGRPGVRAYAVFLPQPGDALLVELGWLPLPADRSLPAVQLPRDISRVQGLLLPPPSGGLVAGVVQRQGDVLLATRLEPQAIAAEMALSVLAPRVLRLDPALSWGYPRDLDVMPNTLTPQRHLGYAVQWFALALAVLVIATLLTLRRHASDE